MGEALDKTNEIRHCAEAALLPLMDGNKEAVKRLLVAQEMALGDHTWRRVAQYLTRNPDLSAEERRELETMAAAGKPTGLTHKKQVMDEINVEAGLNLTNNLTESLSYGFARARNMAIAWSPRMPQSERQGFAHALDYTAQSVMAHRDGCPAEMRKNIETAAKWLDAAHMIATSERPLTAQAAYNLSSLQK